MKDAYHDVKFLSIDIDDVADADLLVHFPKMVRFIERGLYGKNRPEPQTHTGPTASAASTSGPIPTGAVLVHCAAGVSRSVTAVIAYLLWKHADRFKTGGEIDGREAVDRATRWVQQTRPSAEPNPGFKLQLEKWWEMGCPAGTDDDVERSPAYLAWSFQEELGKAARESRSPRWIDYTDRVADGGESSGLKLRCKKCRTVLATERFIIPHPAEKDRDQTGCPHFFVEALSWMRPALETGDLEGRLLCPGPKCKASVGRWAWQGFKCSCGDWVAPAIALLKSRVDEEAPAKARMALGIRMPPGARQGNES
ncbi:tyrosine-protein phosphatase [Echria macrotheca]|uniref:protein-tyrosine-phosphatase n=1 Tax=Echria macrotheca TaxID=438768 RepID=A0AAJ0BL00_9PEZI|nr:tyrosine-protein phosphatase [Echria macrotheca]